MMARIEARISSIDGSCARCARRSASASSLLDAATLIPILQPAPPRTAPAAIKPIRSGVRAQNRSCPRVTQPSKRHAGVSASIGRAHAKLFGLDLVEMNARIVFGDTEAERSDREPAD